MSCCSRRRGRSHETSFEWRRKPERVAGLVRRFRVLLRGRGSEDRIVFGDAQQFSLLRRHGTDVWAGSFAAECWRQAEREEVGDLKLKQNSFMNY